MPASRRPSGEVDTPPPPDHEPGMDSGPHSASGGFFFGQGGELTVNHVSAKEEAASTRIIREMAARRKAAAVEPEKPQRGRSASQSHRASMSSPQADPNQLSHQELIALVDTLTRAQPSTMIVKVMKAMSKRLADTVASANVPSGRPSITVFGAETLEAAAQSTSEMVPGQGQALFAEEAAGRPTTASVRDQLRSLDSINEHTGSARSQSFSARQLDSLARRSTVLKGRGRTAGPPVQILTTKEAIKAIASMLAGKKPYDPPTRLGVGLTAASSRPATTDGNIRKQTRAATPNGVPTSYVAKRALPHLLHRPTTPGSARPMYEDKEHANAQCQSPAQYIQFLLSRISELNRALRTSIDVVAEESRACDRWKRRVDVLERQVEKLAGEGAGRGDRDSMSGSIPPWKTVSASSSGNRRKRRRRSGPSDMKPVVIRRLLASASTKRNSTKSRSKTSLAPGYRDPIPCMPTMRMRKEVVSGTNRPKYWEAWTEEQQAKEGDGAGAKSTDPTTLLRLLIWNEHEDAVEQGGLDEHLADSGIPDVALSQEISRVTEPAPPIKRKILPDQLSRAPKPADPPITPPHPAHVAIPTATSSAPTSQIHSVLNRSRNPKWTTSDNVGKPIRVPQFPRVRPKTSAANTVQTVRTPLIMGRAHTAFTAGNQVGGTDGACVGRGRSKVDLDLGQVPIAVLGGPESFGQIM